MIFEFWVVYSQHIGDNIPFHSIQYLLHSRHKLVDTSQCNTIFQLVHHKLYLLHKHQVPLSLIGAPHVKV